MGQRWKIMQAISHCAYARVSVLGGCGCMVHAHVCEYRHSHAPAHAEDNPCARLSGLCLPGIFLSPLPFSSLGALGLQIRIAVCSFYMDLGDPSSSSHLHNTYFIQ